MSPTGYGTSPEAMDAHIAAVKRISERVDKAAGAGKHAFQNLSAYGVLCQFFGLLVSGMTKETSDMITALSKAGGTCSQGVKDCKTSYEQLEKDMAAMFKGAK